MEKSLKQSMEAFQREFLVWIHKAIHKWVPRKKKNLREPMIEFKKYPSRRILENFQTKPWRNLLINPWWFLKTFSFFFVSYLFLSSLLVPDERSQSYLISILFASVSKWWKYKFENIATETAITRIRGSRLGNCNPM